MTDALSVRSTSRTRQAFANDIGTLKRCRHDVDLPVAFDNRRDSTHGSGPTTEQFDLLRRSVRKPRVRGKLPHPEQFASGVQMVPQRAATRLVQRADAALSVLGNNGEDRIRRDFLVVEKIGAVTGHQDLGMLSGAACWPPATNTAASPVRDNALRRRLCRYPRHAEVRPDSPRARRP